MVLGNASTKRDLGVPEDSNSDKGYLYQKSMPTHLKIDCASFGSVLLNSQVADHNLLLDMPPKDLHEGTEIKHYCSQDRPS